MSEDRKFTFMGRIEEERTWWEDMLLFDDDKEGGKLYDYLSTLPNREYKGKISVILHEVKKSEDK